MKLQIDNLGKVAITVEKDYWDITKCYDRLVAVEREGDCAYLSRKPVPPNILISNREYWIKIGLSAKSPYGISQHLGYDPDIAVSQKAITEKFDDIQRQLDEITGKVTINVAFSPTSAILNTEINISITATLDKEATSIKILRNGVQIGNTGSGTEHTVTTTIEASSMTPIDFVIEAIVNDKQYTKTVSLPVKKNALLVWMKGRDRVTEDTVALGTSHVYPNLYNPEELTPIVYSSSNTNVATINSNGIITLHAVGTTVIKGRFNGDDTYNPIEDAYTLNVTEDTSPKDYYVGWATGENSSFATFRALTGEQLVELATGYKKATKPTITKTITAADIVGSRQILFLMWKSDSAPVSGTFYGGLVAEPLTASSFINDNVFQIQRDVEIDGVTYHVAGMRAPFEVNNYLTVNF